MNQTPRLFNHDLLLLNQSMLVSMIPSCILSPSPIGSNGTGIFTYIYHQKSTKCRQIYNSHGSSGYVFVFPFFFHLLSPFFSFACTKKILFFLVGPSYASWCKSSWVKTSLKKTWSIYDKIYDPWIPPNHRSTNHPPPTATYSPSQK